MLTMWPMSPALFYIHYLTTCQTRLEAAAKKLLSLIYYWAVKDLVMAEEKKKEITDTKILS